LLDALTHRSILETAHRSHYTDTSEPEWLWGK
jgi:hypothetical protein